MLHTSYSRCKCARAGRKEPFLLWQDEDHVITQSPSAVSWWCMARAAVCCCRLETWCLLQSAAAAAM